MNTAQIWSILRSRSFLKNVAAFFALLVLFVLFTPLQLDMAKYKLPASDIEFREADQGFIYTQFKLQPSEGDLSQQFQNRDSQARQFYFEFDETLVAEGRRTLLIPDSGGQVRLSFLGGWAGLSTGHDFFAPGYGTEWKSFEIPRHLLVPGQNQMHIRLTSDATQAGIRRIYLAPTQNVVSASKRYENWMKQLPGMTRLGYGIAFFACLLVMLTNRQKWHYLAMTVLTLPLFFLGLFPLIENLNWISEGIVRWVLPLLVAMCLIAVILTRRNRKDAAFGVFPALALFALLGPLLTLMVQHTSIFWQNTTLMVSLFMLGALPLIFLTAIPDLVTDIGSRRSRLQQLTETVERQSEELDEKTTLIVEEMRQRALMEERQRFTRDIHDGIGGKLLSLLLGVRTGELEREEIASEVQSSIRDLRLVVDSIDQMGEDLDAVLETFRARAIPQLKVAGVALNWEQPEKIEGAFNKNRGHTLHLYRLMQEALTNIVKHAEAQTVHIVISQPIPDRLKISIEDDGVGLDATENNSSGKGITNMKSRAQSIGASFSIQNREDTSGTRIELDIPLAG